jgi:signal transduction histidine kinase/ActR/RegA family two-component response regulator
MPIHSSARRFGLKPKILLMLVGVLALTTILDAALAWYFTNRQNQRAAYDVLRHDLRYWEDDLQGLTRRWQSTAIDAMNDGLTSNELDNLVALEHELDRVSGGSGARASLENRLAYWKASSLNRLYLVLRAARISSILVYVNGSLSHYVSNSEVGMFVKRTGGRQAWIATVPDQTGALQTDNWPSWEERPPPAMVRLSSPEVSQPTVSVDLSAPNVATVQTVVPLGVSNGTSAAKHPVLSVNRIAYAPKLPDPSIGTDSESSEHPVTSAVVVFRKELGRDFLEQTARKTGKVPAIFSPDGLHRQELETFDVSPAELLPLQASQSQSAPRTVERTATIGTRSVYQGFLPWKLAGRPVLILGLASPRISTLQNIRQTVTAILLADAAILLLSIAVGAFWVRRFIDPIVAFTAEVKEMEHRSRLGTQSSPNSQTLVEELKPICVMAPDEVGDLAAAFNAMISELRRSLKTLERRVQERIARDAALAEAERIARLRDRFFAQMSHELRTPLNAILGYAQILLSDRRQLTDRQATGLITIHESGQHLLTLINDILDLSRAQETKLELFPRDVQLAAFLKGVADIVRVKAEQKSLSFTYEAPLNLPATVRADEKRLRQVLLNLLGNAIKFTDSGYVVLRVQPVQTAELRASPDSGPAVRLRFEIEDTGIGMSEEQLSKIFGPFEQVSDSLHREGGAGLGLAISRHLVRLMGGEIRVQSRSGEGSLFSFELDLPRGERSAVRADPLRIASGYRGPRKTVLIVDDVLQNRLMQMQSLSELGFDVAQASNGQEGLELAARLRPDLILMDVMMPVIDGLEAIRRIRARPDLAHLPVIAVSASTSAADEARSLAAGASAFIAKPIHIDTMLHVIGEHLALSWVYEERTMVPNPTGDFSAGALVIPSQEEIEALHDLAQVGNMRDIRDRAEHLRVVDSRYAAFAARLEILAQRYESQAIVTLIERYRTKGE